MAKKTMVGASIPFADAAAHRGEIDFVEENVQRFLMPSAGEAEFDSAARPARRSKPPIRFANTFVPAALKSVGPEVNAEALLEYADTAMRRARRFGIGIIVYGSGGSRTIPDGFDRAKAEEQFLSIVRLMAPIAESHRMTLVIEALNRGECNLINSLAEGAEVVKAVGRPSVRLLADLYHMMKEDEPPSEIARFGPLLAHVHLAEREARSAPGCAGDDFRPFFRELRKAGYAGAFSLECIWQNQQEDVHVGIAELRRQLADAGYA